MKKKLFYALLILLTFLANASYAQVARNASDASIQHSRTNFTNVGATGLDVNGNPGYLALTSSSAGGYTTDWYYYADTRGNLCVASWQTVQAYASFPNGGWADLSAMPCTKVGSQ